MSRIHAKLAGAAEGGGIPAGRATSSLQPTMSTLRLQSCPNSSGSDIDLPMFEVTPSPTTHTLIDTCLVSSSSKPICGPLLMSAGKVSVDR